MKLLRSVSSALALVAGFTSALYAQSGVTITGTVTSDQGIPLPAATVLLQGTNIGAQTNEAGRYTFVVPSTRANGQAAVLTARVIGYTAASIPITLTGGSSISHDFQLAVNPFHLGEVVVTGAGTSTTRERLTTTINTVDSSALRRAVQPQNLVSALTAQAPNVEVRTQSGEPGASASVRIRGATSLTGANQPLFVVDGQPIDNTTTSTQGGNQGTVAMNRAADLNPEDIESIEILKSSAASAIYGARASNGVVVITTKSGHSGPTRFSVTSTETWDKPRLPDMLQRSYGQGSNGVNAVCGGADCAMTPLSWGAPLAAGTPVYNHENELFDTGLTADNNIQISGGNDRTTFFVSGGLTSQDGYFKGPNNRYNRTSARLKGSHRLSSQLTVGGNFSYIDGRGKFVQKGSNVSGLMLGALRTPPNFNNLETYTASGLQRPYRFPEPTSVGSMLASAYYDNPFFVLDNPGNRTELGRSISNINADWNPLSWLNVKYTLGADYYNDNRLQALPLTSANDKPGNVIRFTATNLEIDHNLLATARRDFGSSIDATFTIGQNLNSRRYRQLADEGDGLIAPFPLAIQNTVDKGASNLLTLVFPFSGTSEYRSLAHIESYFAQTELSFYDQLVVNAGIRNDGFSTFGASTRRHNFPKASAAWTFTKALGDFGSGVLNYGKVHIAYGETGKEPPIYAAVTTLTSGQTFGSGYADAILSSINGQGGLVTSQVEGNPALRPERNRENEYGVDLGLLGNRVDLSATYYTRRADDVILGVPVNSSGTGAQFAVKNAASITNKGTEITLNLRPVTTASFAWDAGIQFGQNRGNVKNLNGAEFIPYNSEGFNGGIGSSTVGFAPGVIRGSDFVLCGRGLILNDAAHTDVDAVCGPEANAQHALYLGANGRPIVDNTDRVIADPNPHYTMSYKTGVTLWNKLRVSGLLDVRKGGQVWNQTKSVLNNFGTSKETEIRSEQGVFGQNFLTDVYPHVAGPGAGIVAFHTPQEWQAWFTGNGGGFGPVGAQAVEDASYAKLREISATYTLDQAWVRSATGFSTIDVKIGGRNLKTWTKYKGYDPEVNLGGAEYLTQGLDYFINPPTRSFVLAFSFNR
ncbi:MAG TPA: SusC/RagA family TonB-linked outer membrane protein [Gemmatimonadaceae bacterium]|nr:SusC/RagA family TonB-linked outer membrane protein [Gemmatimonadaceae bacterium]